MNKYLTSTWNRIAAFLAACALVAVMGAIGANDANAARIVGRVDAPGVSATSGTDIVRITLSPGNPDDDNSTASGSISGVTIHLERLKGVSPSSPQDREKVENATAAKLAEWPKDLHFSQVTDENGSVKFSDLPEGIYLVTSTAPNESYREINPFLVSVPFYGADYDSTPVEGVIVAKSHKPGRRHRRRRLRPLRRRPLRQHHLELRRLRRAHRPRRRLRRRRRQLRVNREPRRQRRLPPRHLMSLVPRRLRIRRVHPQAREVAEDPALWRSPVCR